MNTHAWSHTYKYKEVHTLRHTCFPTCIRAYIHTLIHTVIQTLMNNIHTYTQTYNDACRREYKTCAYIQHKPAHTYACIHTHISGLLPTYAFTTYLQITQIQSLNGLTSFLQIVLFPYVAYSWIAEYMNEHTHNAGLYCGLFWIDENQWRSWIPNKDRGCLQMPTWVKKPLSNHIYIYIYIHTHIYVYIYIYIYNMTEYCNFSDHTVSWFPTFYAWGRTCDPTYVMPWSQSQ